jgi:16S rRNA G966 N2-methylase RsmD
MLLRFGNCVRGSRSGGRSVRWWNTVTRFTSWETQPGKMGQPFDIVFLDPPFASGLLPSVCRLLEDGHWLSANALIYVETDAQAGLPPLSQNWEVTRTKQAGAVGYHLLTRMRGDSGG